ncbi:MAG: ligase-associated DNA damage response DEXH box helicase [Schleiferiaceae bacterium]
MWFSSLGWKAFPFQTKTWEAYASGKSGLINAPTGSGKTYSILLPIIENGPEKPKGLQAIWITPIRALALEIEKSSKRAVAGMNPNWTVEIRTGDTSAAVKNRQRRSLPNLLITTPESLHLLMAQKGYADRMKNLQTVVVDEWHELLGSKRAVQMELGLSRLRGINPNLQLWGISATIGNMEDAVSVLFGSRTSEAKIIVADIEKAIVVESVLPDEVETLPWAGHLGIKLLDKVLPIVAESTSTLIFTNTRAQAEIWYQKILETQPDLAGQIAMHHSSLSKDIRTWVEDALHEGKLKAVVCTSSLDLGVDFRPVETIIQVGSPKGVARFIQRAGRSGHSPGQVSTIYFVPTHSLELIEASALRRAIEEGIIEDRSPYYLSIDVLIQYLVTLAVSDGFIPEELYPEIRSTFSFQHLTEEQWQFCLRFITVGGASFSQYDEFQKVDVVEGVYKVTSRKVAMRHRFSMGTIVSDVNLAVKFSRRGGYLGTIEESFISKLKPGQAFWFAGQTVEFDKVTDMTALVRKSKQKKALVPSWSGGRMPLSAQLGELLRLQLEKANNQPESDVELNFIQPIITRQKLLSVCPNPNQFLIEKMESKEGHHVFFFPFEGRLVHEGLAQIIGYRLGLITPISFSIAMNDYGFELLSDSEIPIEEGLDSDIFTDFGLEEDIHRSINENELASRKFRDIATISGTVFKGFPHKPLKDKHIQSTSSLIYKVFSEYEPDNLLLQQAHEEVRWFQLEEQRLRNALKRIENQEIVVTYPEMPTPMAFPIMVDRLREKMSSENLADRIRKMQAELLRR